MVTKIVRKIWREVKRPFRKLVGGHYAHKWIGPDQWNGEHSHKSIEIYEELANLDRAQLQEKYSNYWKRIEPVVQFCQGVVLELGCGSGNVTRWINEVDAVEKIYCIDLFEKPISQLKERGYSKAIPICGDITQNDVQEKIKEQNVDTVVLCEIIEHLPQQLENEILKSIRQYVRSQVTKWVVSTPIGFMLNPHHCRGFSKVEFIAHLKKHYGAIDSIHYTEIQQTGCGWFY